MPRSLLRLRHPHRIRYSLTAPLGAQRNKWLDYERIVALIKTANYNGCISIVYEGEHQDRVEQIRLAAAYLRHCLAGF